MLTTKHHVELNRGVIGKLRPEDIAAGHPCFDERAHYYVPRLHLPVAPRCNIQCNFCARSVGKKGVPSRPGVSAEVLRPEEAQRRADSFLGEDERGVVGIAGPGDPLANPEALETLRLIRKQHPDAVLCLCTNGLELVAWLPQLQAVELNAITVTVNAVDPIVGAKIYAWVKGHGGLLRGEEAARWLTNRQLEGLRRAAEAGIAVKVNTVLVPGINDQHLPEVAQAVKEAGAILMNIMPLIPCYRFASHRAPSFSELREVRRQCAQIIPQFALCKQCRADVVGTPGKCDLRWEEWAGQ